MKTRSFSLYNFTAYTKRFLLVVSIGSCSNAVEYVKGLMQNECIIFIMYYFLKYNFDLIPGNKCKNMILYPDGAFHCI